MNAAIAMVITSTSILLASIYIALAGIETVDFEAGIDFRRPILSSEEPKKSKKKRKKKKKSR